MITGIFKVIFYAFLIYIAYLIIRFFQLLNKRSKSPQPKKRPSGMMVKDEFCNTYLPKEDALKEIIEGQERYFCSNECRKKFLESKKSH